MKTKSCQTLKRVLDLNDYPRSPYYVGFFEFFDSKNFSFAEERQHLVLWFMQKAFEYPGVDVFWQAWLLPKRQIMEDPEQTVCLPLIQKMRRSGTLMTRREFLSECSKDRKFRRQFAFQKDAPVELCVDLLMSRTFTDIASRYFFVNRNLELIFIYHEDEGFDLAGLSEKGRAAGVKLLKEIRQQKGNLWRCVLTCEGEFINKDTEYPYQIQVHPTSAYQPPGFQLEISPTRKP